MDTSCGEKPLYVARVILLLAAMFSLDEAAAFGKHFPTRYRFINSSMWGCRLFPYTHLIDPSTNADVVLLSIEGRGDVLF